MEQESSTFWRRTLSSERSASLEVLPDLHRVLVVRALDLLVEVLVAVVDVVDVCRAVLRPAPAERLLPLPLFRR